VREWIDQLVSQRFLHMTGEYQVLAVTDTGRGVLRGLVTPRLLRPSSEKLDGASSASTASLRRSLKPNAALTRAFELFAAGKSLDEVAEAVERAKSTTAGYLEQYIRAQGLCQPQPWVDQATADRVLQAVRATGTRDRLTPIYQALNAEVSYEQIRVVFACLANAEARQANSCPNPTESGEAQL
jgi:ATP-dependent DNA helicase RecQ